MHYQSQSCGHSMINGLSVVLNTILIAVQATNLATSMAILHLIAGWENLGLISAVGLGSESAEAGSAPSTLSAPATGWLTVYERVH